MSDETKPGKPRQIGDKNVDTVQVEWDPPKNLLEPPCSYELRYKYVTSGEQSKWIRPKDRPSKCSLMLENVPSGAKFVFQVRQVNEDDEGPFSEQSDEIETIQSAASQMLPGLIDVRKEKSEMSVKGLPFIEDKSARDETAKTRKLVLGKENRNAANEKIIMVLGPTGAGKSTLIDGMINYIFGISWRDTFRLTVENLEAEELLVKKDQSSSQTTWITCYTINPMAGTRIPYKLTIIDTPGYGDVRGIEADKGITEQIRHLFTAKDNKGIFTLDAVCFVIKAPDARLTNTQQYIFNSVLSVFQKDIIENFCMLISFSDGQEPPVLAALKKAKLPHEEYFCFNNSALFSANTGKTEQDLDRSIMDWNMGQKGFRQFFEALQKLKTKSLALSKEVLNERKNIEITIENMREKLGAAFDMGETLKKQIELMKLSTEEIRKNKDFTYPATETTCKVEPSDSSNLNCTVCKSTCHKSCWSWNINVFIRSCDAFYNGYCTQCDLKCIAESHVNEKWIYRYQTITVTKTYEDVKQKYEEAAKKTLDHGEFIAEMERSMEKLEQEIKTMIDAIIRSNKRLEVIALRDDPLSAEDLYDGWITEEETNKKDGWQDRVKKYRKLQAEARKKADIENEAKNVEQKFKKLKAEAKNAKQ